jgi:hypothetical protein
MDIAITILISTPVLNTAVTDLWRRTSQRCDPEHVGHRKAPVASKRMAGAGTGVYAAMLVRGGSAAAALDPANVRCHRQRCSIYHGPGLIILPLPLRLYAPTTPLPFSSALILAIISPVSLLSDTLSFRSRLS